MSMPSPFELGAGLTQAAKQGYTGRSDRNAIDQILSQASQSKDPNAIYDMMDQILARVSPANQERAISVLQAKAANIQNQNMLAKREQALQEAGLNPAYAYLPDQAITGALRPEKKTQSKPGVFATMELKSWADRAQKLPGLIGDAKRGLEIVKEASLGRTGYMIKPGAFYSDEQQEFEGIASRLLTGGFKVLPRIISEFESFKKGQVSLANTASVNERMLKDQLAGYELEEQIINRLEQYLSEGMDETEAYNTVKGEFLKPAQDLLQSMKETQENIESSKGMKLGKVTPGTPVTEEAIDAAMEIAKQDWEKAAKLIREAGYVD